MEESEELEFEDATIEQQRTLILEGIARGEQAIAEGRLVSHEEVKRMFSRWLDPESGF